MSKPTPNTERDELRELLLRRIGIPANIYVNIDDKSNNLDTILQAFATQKKQLLEAVLKTVGESEIEYKKYEPCPVCVAEYMYRCSCSESSDYVTGKIRAHIKKLMEEKV